MAEDLKLRAVKHYWQRLTGSLVGFLNADQEAEPVSPSNPLPVTVIGGSIGGGSGDAPDVSALLKEATFSDRIPTKGQKATAESLPVVLPQEQVDALKTPVLDTASARETTMQETRDAVRALAPLLGSTDGLEALAAANRDLLTSLGSYTDGLESLLGMLNTNTDGIEDLLSALGVKDDNVLSKLEAVRLLLAATLTVQGSVSVSRLPDVQQAHIPQTLTVGAAAASLTVPAGANRATVHVISGAVHRNISGAPGAQTPVLLTGDSEELAGAELAAYRVVRSGDSDAVLHIEYGTVA